MSNWGKNDIQKVMGVRIHDKLKRIITEMTRVPVCNKARYSVDEDTCV